MSNQLSKKVIVAVTISWERKGVGLQKWVQTYVISIMFVVVDMCVQEVGGFLGRVSIANIEWLFYSLLFPIWAVHISIWPEQLALLAELDTDGSERSEKEERRKRENAKKLSYKTNTGL